MNQQRTTLGSGSASNFISDELNAVVFEANGAKFTRIQLDAFIIENKDMISHWVKTLDSFTLPVMHQGMVIHDFTFNKRDADIFTEEHQLGKKKVLDLFSPELYAIFYGTAADIPVASSIVNDIIKRCSSLRDALLELSPEDTETIDEDPLTYVINLIKQFIETKKEVESGSIKMIGVSEFIESDYTKEPKIINPTLPTEDGRVRAGMEADDKEFFNNIEYKKKQKEPIYPKLDQGLDISPEEFNTIIHEQMIEKNRGHA